MLQRPLILFELQRQCSVKNKQQCFCSFALPKLKYCQKTVTKQPLPQPLVNITQTCKFTPNPITKFQEYKQLSKESQESFESAHLQSAFKDIHQSLGFSYQIEIIGVFQLQIQHLKQLHARVSDLQVLANTHQQKLDARLTNQIQIITELSK
ncbi:Hypothetical_protein [Hexamita inflata]|uniref:Hypothetical_protein n=1 Tax=Hexamita inflata TaxID=28002 RepID=A0AA86R6D6_9EUKA|nr:Hypothetical protein HINF_LOCUS54532 [Hexamita inflata]